MLWYVSWYILSLDKGDWDGEEVIGLNMAEIEFSVLRHPCLSGHIPN